jgi:hypothetical protein
MLFDDLRGDVTGQQCMHADVASSEILADLVAQLRNISAVRRLTF